MENILEQKNSSKVAVEHKKQEPIDIKALKVKNQLIRKNHQPGTLIIL